MAFRAPLAAVLLLVLSQAAAAQENGLPDARIVVRENTDFYGGDIRAIFDTGFDPCVAACVADSACTAITFNGNAGACFLKSGHEDQSPFTGARSAEILRPDAARIALAAERAAELSFLDYRLSSARSYAAGLGSIFPANDFDAASLRAGAADYRADGNHEQAFWNMATVAVLEDDPADWQNLAADQLAAAIQRPDYAGDYNGQALNSATSAYLRSDDPVQRAAILRLLAQALEATGSGSLGIPALRLAQSLSPAPETAADLSRLIGLFGFRVTETRVDSDAADPRACMIFSESLADAGVAYGDFVVTRSGPAEVSVSGAELCIEGLSHGQNLNVTLRAGLPSASGEALSESSELAFYIRDRSPSLRFTGRAYVLPRSGDPALPVISVNAPDAELAIYHVPERGLRDLMRDGYFGSWLAGYDTDYLKGELGEKLWEGHADLATALNEEVVTTLPLGEAIGAFEPGVYALTARVPGADVYSQGATQWFVVSDLGLATMKGNDGLHVFLRSLGTAEPVGAVRVDLISSSNEILGSATADDQGYARLDPALLRGTGGAAPALITVSAPDGDFSFLPLTDAGFDLSDRGVEGRPPAPPVDVFVSTERGIYRPGETLFATILARDAAVEAVTGLPLTAVVERPDGVEHSRHLLPDQGAGGRVLALPLEPAAMRGGWKLRLYADPDDAPLATASFLVEDFVPEKLDFDPVLPEGAVDPANLPVVTLEGRYLYGAPAAGLLVEGEVTLAPAATWPGFEGYRFGRGDQPSELLYASLSSGILTDAGGRADVPLVLPEGPAPAGAGTLTATLRLIDGTGRPVEREVTRALRPAGPVIGIRPMFGDVAPEDAPAGFEVIALGPSLERDVTGPADWTLTRVETNYQWYQLDGTWNYEPVTRRERIASGTITLGPGTPARIEAPVTWGQFELEVLLADGSTVPPSALLGFSAGWYAAASGTETPDFLEVALDKPAYAPGETANLRIMARDPGKVLVTVLSDHLIAMQGTEVPAGPSSIAIPVTADWGPGAYVTATLIRPMEEAAGRNPARALGLVWAGVDPGPHRLGLTIDAPAEIRPNGPLAAAVTVAGLAAGEEAYVTLAAVDLGILNMTGFEAPDPSAHYFGQRQLGMEIRDLYGRLIDGLTGTRGSLRSGGDGAQNRTGPPPTEKLVAFFQGPVKAGPDGRAEIAFTLPDFNGTVRLMAIGWTAGGVGQASAEVLVRDHVVVTAGLPRFLAPGDTSRLLLDLAPTDGTAGTARVQVLASAGLDLASSGPFDVALAPAGAARLEIPLTAGAEGAQSLSVAVTTPGGEVLIRDLTLDIRRNDPAVARQSRFTLAAGSSLTLGPEVMEGLRPEGALATLAIGGLARFDAPALLAALDAYPYGCTEQITSRALPLLYFDDVARTLGLDGAERAGERIAEAIRAVLANQSGAGGFGLWEPGQGDLWLDAYVTDFLTRASAEGHEVPDKALRTALNNLRNSVNTAPDFENAGEGLAYALFVLAREGEAAIGDLRYYADIKAEDFATPLARAQLGAALAAYGDQRRADAMFRLAEAAAALPEDDGLWRVDYGTRLRDQAGLLTLAAEAGSSAVNLPALAGAVAAAGPDRSTQENLWSLLAARALAAQVAEGAVTINGAVPEGPLVRRLTAAGLTPALEVTNTGAQPVDTVVTSFGVPETPLAASGNGYRIGRAWFTMTGEPADLTSIEPNTRLVAVVTVTPERESFARLMVEDPLPAGFEIDNPNLVSAGTLAGLDWLAADEVAANSEFLTDRFRAAVDWSGMAPFSLAYVVRAVSPGEFHLPAASVADMYRPAYRAVSDAGRVTIGPAG
jgi:hypothetical protein